MRWSAACSRAASPTARAGRPTSTRRSPCWTCRRPPRTSARSSRSPSRSPVPGPRGPGLGQGIARKELDRRRRAPEVPGSADADERWRFPVVQRQELRRAPRRGEDRAAAQRGACGFPSAGCPSAGGCSPTAIRCARAARCRSAWPSPRPMRWRAPTPTPSPDRSATRCSPVAAACTSASPTCSTIPRPTHGRCIASPTSTRDSSRAGNAAFQSAVTQFRDPARAQRRPAALRPRQGEVARQHRACDPGARTPRRPQRRGGQGPRAAKGPDFDQTRLYARVFALADRAAGQPAPRAVVPRIPLRKNRRSAAASPASGSPIASRRATRPASGGCATDRRAGTPHAGRRHSGARRFLEQRQLRVLLQGRGSRR